MAVRQVLPKGGELLMTPENPQVPKIPDELVEKADVRVNDHQEERTLPLKDVEEIRRSVAEGVERVVKPFWRRVEAQSRIRNRNIRIRSAA